MEREKNRTQSQAGDCWDLKHSSGRRAKRGNGLASGDSARKKERGREREERGE